MAIRFYLLPLEQIENRIGPKYLRWRGNPTGIAVRWNLMDYGLMPVAIVVADVTGGQHVTLSANPDVVVIPLNIDAKIAAGALSQVQSSLETLNIPAEWVTIAHTYRQVLRVVASLFQLAQRYHGRYAARLIEAGYNLNTLISELPANVRANLNTAAQSMGWDTSQIIGDWTLRMALLNLAEQWGNTPFYMGITEL